MRDAKFGFASFGKIFEVKFELELILVGACLDRALGVSLLWRLMTVRTSPVPYFTRWDFKLGQTKWRKSID